MVRGLERFREHFRGFTDRYVLIGGTACDLLMDEAGLAFRATADLDIVLRIEALDPSFVEALWSFIEEGGYLTRQHTSGSPRLYRFLEPMGEDFPVMLELLSRVPDVINLPEGAHLTPIPVDDPLPSLSAIVMDASYYEFLHSGIRVLEDLPIVDAEHLIPLKAKAFLNLSARRAKGLQVQSGDIRKHRNDVFRLYRVMDSTLDMGIPQVIREDMTVFLEAMGSEEVALRQLGITDRNKETVLQELREMYLRDD